MINKYIKALTLTSLLFLCAYGSQAEHLYNKGNVFYENKEFDSAVVYYEQALDQGILNSSLFYNLGNAYYRLENQGRAILNYERASKLNPRDKDIEANLKYARMNITDRIAEQNKSFLEISLDFIHDLLPLTLQLTTIIILLFIISICFSLVLFIRGNRRLWFIYAAVLSSIVLLLFSISAGIKIYNLEKHEYAIVLEDRIDAKNEPDGNKTLFSVHEGTKFQIIKKDRLWYYVSLSNGVSGWVKSEALEKI